MTTRSFYGQVAKVYDGIDPTAITEDRIFFTSDGTAGLTANRPYWRDTSVSTPVDLTIGAVWANNYNYRSVNSTQVLLATDNYIGANHAGAITLTLPAISGLSNNKNLIIIKDESGNASTNNITIDTSGGDTVEGVASIIIEFDFQSVSLYSDGSSNWYVF